MAYSTVRPKKLRALLAALFLGVTLVCTAASARRAVTLDDLRGVAGAPGETLDLSADGRRLAVERDRRLLVLDVNSGRILHELGGGVLPIWSPTGRRLAFYSSRTGDMQLWMWDAYTGRTDQLTDIPEGIDPDPTTRIMARAIDSFQYSWSPDGRRIVFASRVAAPSVVQKKDGPLVLTNSTPPHLTLSGVFAQPDSSTGVPEARDGRTLSFRSRNIDETLCNHLFIVDTTTRELTQLTTGLRTFFHPSWSPDGRTIVASGVALEEAGGEDVLYTVLMTRKDRIGAEIFSIDIATRRQRIVAAGNNDVKHYPLWSRDGTKISYLASPTILEDPEVHVIKYPSGEPHGVIAHEGRKIWAYRWANARDEFVIQYSGDGGLLLGKVRLASQKLSVVTPVIELTLGAGFRAWSRAQDGSMASIQGTHVWHLPAGAKRSVQLFDFSDTELSLGRVETIRWRNERGEDMQGELLYPPEYQPRKRYPLIVDAYPLGGGGWMFPLNGNQAWASAGYVVFKPKPRAPHVWMNAAAASSVAGKGPEGWNVTVDDVMSGIDALVSRGIVDPERMCLHGHSNGGGVVSYLVTRTSRFKCAVVIAPAMANWIRPALLRPNGRDEVEAFSGGFTFTENPNDYIALSSVFHLHKVTTPMLIAVGDKDGDFLLNAIEVYNGVRSAGTEVTLVRYPDQGHLFTGDALRDFWSREMSFLERFLHPTHSPRNSRATKCCTTPNI